MGTKGIDAVNEQQLVIRLNNLDREAFEMLYNKYSPRLYRYALKFVKSPEIAEDIVHDVFVKVWGQLASLDPEGSIQAYLYKITQNSMLNLIKRGSVESKFVEEMMYHAESMVQTTDQSLQYKEAMQQAQQAIDTLPPKRKQIYKLSRDLGMSHRQIALELNITDSTVNNQMVKAIKTIRDFLSLRGTIG